MNGLTVNDYLDNLELDRQDMINSLKSKGMEISDISKFKELIPYIDTLDDINNYYDTTKKTSGDFITYITKMPSIDTSSYTNMNQMFYGFESLEEISELDTSNVTSMDSTFYLCYKLKSIPQINTSKVNSMRNTFTFCRKLTEIPELDTSNVTNMYYIFQGCNSLITIPQLDAGKVNTTGSMFYDCWALETFGGLKDLGKAYSTTASANNNNYKFDLSSSSKLTHDSLMNAINNLYDIATKGCKTQKLILGSTNLAKLTEDEIAIATNKGWTVS